MPETQTSTGAAPVDMNDAAAQALNNFAALTGDQAPFPEGAPPQPQPQQQPQPQPQPQTPLQSQQPPDPTMPPADAPIATPDALTQGVLSSMFGIENTTDAAPTSPVVQDDPITPEEEEAVKAASGKNQKTGHAWARLRESEKRNRERVTELESQIATETGNVRNEMQRQIEERDKQIAELEESLGKVNLAASPRFREKYDGRIAAAAKKLANNLAQHGKMSPEDAAKRAIDIIHSDIDGVDTATRDMKPSLAGLVMSAWQEAQDVVAERKAVLDDWRKTRAALEHDDRAVRTQAEIKHRRDTALQAIADASANGCFVYAPLGTPESQEAATAYRDAFLGFAQQATPDDLMRKAADGFAAPTLYEIIRKQGDVIRQLRLDQRASGSLGALPISAQTPMGRPAPAPSTPVADDNRPLMDIRDDIAGGAALEIRKALAAH